MANLQECVLSIVDFIKLWLGLGFLPFSMYGAENNEEVTGFQTDITTFLRTGDFPCSAITYSVDMFHSKSFCDRHPERPMTTDEIAAYRKYVEENDHDPDMWLAKQRLEQYEAEGPHTEEEQRRWDEMTRDCEDCHHNLRPSHFRIEDREGTPALIYNECNSRGGDTIAISGARDKVKVSFLFGPLSQKQFLEKMKQGEEALRCASVDIAKLLHPPTSVEELGARFEVNVLLSEIQRRMRLPRA